MKIKLSKSMIGWIACPVFALLVIGAVGLTGTLKTICMVTVFTILIGGLFRLFWAIGTEG
jgi:hypothetical protein